MKNFGATQRKKRFSNIKADLTRKKREKAQKQKEGRRGRGADCAGSA